MVGRTVSLLLICLLTFPAVAANDLWRFCGEPSPLLPVSRFADERIRISAERTFSAIKGVTELEGDVRLTQGDRLLLADRMKVDQLKQESRGSGHVTFRTPEYQLTAESALMSMNSAVAKFNGVTYRYPERHAQGRALQTRRDAQRVTYLQEATYSTCLASQEDWVVVAKEMVLDPNTEVGTAKHAYLKFKGVPFLYTPFFSFPLGESRKSGFLAPVIENSSSRGLEVNTPYYWNIKPQADATLTPRWMSERGTQILSEMRYLDRWGDWHLDADYLDRDQKLNNEKRYFYRLRHKGLIDRRWHTSIDAGEVSDKNYFNDLGNRLSVATITHLERRADVAYHADRYVLSSRIQNFQTLDDSIAVANRPYQRMPQLNFDGRFPALLQGSLKYDVDVELVRFDREESDTGLRFDSTSKVSWPYRKTAGFFTPSLSVRHSQYALNLVAAGAQQIQRTVPLLSLDAGLYFDREPSSEGGPLQVLEPRLYYLNAPFTSQDEIPLFDSSQLGFSYAQLFRNNRFTGGDRVGDANQLAAGLTYRLIDSDSGREMMSGSLGRIYYFADREVTLRPTQQVDEQPRSDLIAEAKGRFSRNWSVNTTFLINSETGNTDRADFQFRYRRDNEHIANIRYLFSQTAQEKLLTEQVDLAMRWPLSKQWRVMAHWNYSLKEEKVLDSFAGLEYESCCWLLRLVGREFLNVVNGRILDDQTQTALYAQLVLKGLAPVGQGPRKLLEDGIIGYRAIEY
ncbi:MAG: LPS-assembly protein LptD [Gammaproteobacteria bacterium]|nr:LPS-assembly protein LptD [Gammaproteobacteria bacterium]